MVAFPHSPRQGRLGGGAQLINDLQSGQMGWAFPWMDWGWGYKLKIDSRHSGYWDYNRTTAITAGTSQVITLGTTFEGTPFPTNMIVEAVFVRVITPFAGVTAPVMSVGDAGNDDEWVDLFDLTASAGLYIDSGDTDAAMADDGVPVPEAAYAPIVTLGTGAGNLTALTAGEVDIIFKLRPFPPTLPAYQP
jgi:hypothetical protein